MLVNDLSQQFARSKISDNKPEQTVTTDQSLTCCRPEKDAITDLVRGSTLRMSFPFAMSGNKTSAIGQSSCQILPHGSPSTFLDVEVIIYSHLLF